MRALAPWAGKTIVDLGCGTGFWLSRYAAEAARVIGIEPDPAVRAGAERTAQDLAPATLEAVISVESGGSPLALNVNGLSL